MPLSEDLLSAVQRLKKAPKGAHEVFTFLSLSETEANVFSDALKKNATPNQTFLSIQQALQEKGLLRIRSHVS